ncbi:MAG: DNA-binding protein [Ignavibacteriae bacterium]|nr:DNA-binding protein [Ignavibacteriota bacterium]
MSKDLTSSAIDRQNILNNPYAVEEIQTAAGITGIVFNGEIKFIKDQLASFFEVDVRTVNRYLETHSDELSKNGYEVLRGKRLQEFKLAIKTGDVKDMNVLNTVPQIGIFNFRSFLDLAMLLTESERAKTLRGVILDIVIDTINKKTGGGTKYINQRDEDFIVNYLRGEDYRKEFTDALRDVVDMGKAKYPIYTDKIYKSIFKENTQEYRQILKLHSKENVRDTMYAEVLLVISSFEAGFAEVLQNQYKKLERKLTPFEVDALYAEFESQRLWVPQIEDIRTKMASRDLGFRDALHIRLKEYIGAIPTDDFERFLGEKSKDLSARLEEMSEVFKRLKVRE